MSIIRQLARVANRIDSASTGTFLSKGDSTGDFTTVNYTDLSGRPTTLDSAALTSIVDSAYIQLRQTSAGSGGLDSAGITALVDSNYVVARSPAAASGFAQYEYTATAGQTTFQDSDINGNVMSYTADGIFVFYNGVLIAPTTDYTASDGSSVVLTTGADSGSHVAISKWNIASGGSSGSGGASISWGGNRAFILGGGNSYSNEIEYFDITTPGNSSDFGDLSATLYAPGSASDGSRVLSASGYDGSNQLTAIDYITSSSLSNASSFGSLTQGRATVAGHSDATYGVFGGGGNSAPIASGTNTIDYVTIATTSNASDFGDLTTSVNWLSSGGDATYALFLKEVIDYITIQTTSNASDFGDIITGRGGGSRSQGTITSETISVFAGGGGNFIDYVTTASPGNATDFGDTLQSTYIYNVAGSSNGTTGTISGGVGTGGNENVIQYITIATPSNATDFGDLTSAKARCTGSSGSPS